MACAEFDLIRRFFGVYLPQHPYNQLGIGDDCALFSIPDAYQLAVTTDTMVENVHFFADVDPQWLGHKLLAVNLSDLAAMGAEPFAVTLALTLPKVDTDWLKSFSLGFMNLARQFNVDLMGGDTTSGPLTLTVQAMGVVPKGKALLRSTAKVGDGIFVSGQLGNAGLGLKIKQGYNCNNPEQMLISFHKPQPRITQGLSIRELANACIDISDGLASDLGHILQQSGVGACIQYDQLPLSWQVKDYIKLTGDYIMPLTAGDDYELCFTVAPQRKAELPDGFYQIGVIEAESGLRLLRDGHMETVEVKGFEHFA
ncbi:thiamine-phosphate kinase [Methylomonas sp. AM2-LC]|uniref:thiamine-phosphate kinase n=1 Tax=Methylomonas sp. AM2-LC TaxID=3153301 RepID=UPI0032671B83